MFFSALLWHNLVWYSKSRFMDEGWGLTLGTLTGSVFASFFPFCTGRSKMQDILAKDEFSAKHMFSAKPRETFGACWAYFLGLLEALGRPGGVQNHMFCKFQSYRPDDRSIWSKICCGIWFWDPLFSSSAKTLPSWRKLICQYQKNRRKENRRQETTLRDCPKRNLVNFCANPSHDRNVNGRSKLSKCLWF